MFAKLKKKIAEEAAIAPRPGGATRIPRSVSKESITSVGADSGDDFASDGSSSREDLSSQLLRRNEQIRKLEAKLSDYAEQVRNLQKIKEKLEIALEKHQDSSMKKFQEQNEAYQANRAKMAEGMALALEKKDQEWREKLVHLEKEKEMLSAQLQEMREQSLNLFQKRDEIDELEGFQQQELAKVKHMLLKKEESLSRAEQELEACSQELTHAKKELQVTSSLSLVLSNEVEELRQQHSELEAQRDELVAAEANAENKITDLEQRGQELQTFIQHLSTDLQNVIDEKNKLIEHLQEKVSSLEKRLEGNFSGDEHVWELIKEKTALEQKLDDTRQQLLTARTNHAETVNLLETQVFPPPSSMHSVGLKELSSRETVSVEIAKALEETRKQREELQQQVCLLLEPLDSYRADLLCSLPLKVLALEAARAFNKHLYPPEDSEVEQNGEVAAADILQLQKDNRDLGQQISEKNKYKMVFPFQKIRPDNEIPEVREKPNSEVPNAAMTVTNNSDLNDCREINFEYLKHVVLKFMSCRESEAFHLIKAVSVLLNFSQEEENMLKETLEYKMSWFGSKPSPKGSIRPSISNPRTAWS
uniref:Golgin subfamily A member 1 n=1 Tax=Chelonoidis abingdonii TaxID=106734 RepID=A0A8C0FYX0_CHEAB